MHYIIVNELHLKGRNIKKLDTVKAVFDRAEIKYEVLKTTCRGHATELTKSITKEGGHTIVAMGGDGTLHDILNGFEDFDNNALGLIPFGTGNDFAASAGIPSDVRKAAEIIAFRAPSNIDYIQLSNGLRSLNSVGMGIDVEVLKRVYAGNHHGKTKYVRSLLACLFKYNGFTFTAEFDGRKEKHCAIIGALGNGKQLGGGIKLFPEAEIADGYMNLIIVDYVSRIKLIGAVLKLKSGKINTVKETTAVRVKSAKFTIEDSEFFIQAEGELYKNVTIEAEVIHGRLKFYL